MRKRAFSIAIVLGLLFSVILGVQPEIANAIDGPTVPLIIDDPNDATGDEPWMIEISKVYVTHDSANLSIRVEGPTIMRDQPPGGPMEGQKYSNCYIYLNDLEVRVYDSNPEMGVVILESTYGSVEGPCIVTIPLSELGGATEICIQVETFYSHYYAGNWHDSSDLAPDTDCETYYITDQLTVEIDIKPGSFPNSINPDSKGVIPVAILTTEDFDASTVYGATARFGPDEASPVHDAIEDVDNDGDDDMILHFKTEETGIKADDTEATLTAETTGMNIIGTDSVRTVPS